VLSKVIADGLKFELSKVEIRLESFEGDYKDITQVI